MYPGNCWAFRGSQGYLVVRLSMEIRPTSFALEHIPKTLSPTGNITSAPRDFSVYVSVPGSPPRAGRSQSCICPLPRPGPAPSRRVRREGHLSLLPGTVLLGRVCSWRSGSLCRPSRRPSREARSPLWWAHSPARAKEQPLSRPHFLSRRRSGFGSRAWKMSIKKKGSCWDSLCSTKMESHCRRSLCW